MAYYVAIRAYGASQHSDSDVEESSLISLGVPYNLNASKAGDTVTVVWDYTYGEGDGLDGFLVYIGTSPMADWDAATDVGLTGGDAGTPTEQFTAGIVNNVAGTLYIAVRAYASGLPPADSEMIYILVNPSRPEKVRVHGTAADVGLWNSCIEATPTGDPSPKVWVAGELGISQVITITDANGDHALTFTCGLLTDYELTPP